MPVVDRSETFATQSKSRGDGILVEMKIEINLRLTQRRMVPRIFGGPLCVQFSFMVSIFVTKILIVPQRMQS